MDQFNEVHMAFMYDYAERNPEATADDLIKACAEIDLRAWWNETPESEVE